MRIVTWNINSVRLRMPIVEKLTQQVAPDVICLQETKVHDDQFPFQDIQALGYPHIAINGIKGYNGVCILSKHPVSDIGPHSWILLTKWPFGSVRTGRQPTRSW